MNTGAADPKVAELTKALEAERANVAAQRRVVQEFLSAAGGKDKDEALTIIKGRRGSTDHPAPAPKGDKKPDGGEDKPPDFLPARPKRPRMADPKYVRKDADENEFFDRETYDKDIDDFGQKDEAWREHADETRKRLKVAPQVLEAEVGALPSWLLKGGPAETPEDDTEDVRTLVEAAAYAEASDDSEIPSPDDFRKGRERFQRVVERAAARRILAANKDADGHRSDEPPAGVGGKPATEPAPAGEQMTAEKWAGMSRADRAKWMVAHPRPD